MAKNLTGEKDTKNNKYVSFIDHHYNLAAQIFFTHHALSKAKQSQLLDIGITYVEFQLLWAVEGLGKYTEAASGIFMVMVCGGGILPLFQGFIADISASYIVSYWVVFAALVYMLFYALIGSKVTKRAEEVTFGS